MWNEAAGPTPGHPPDDAFPAAEEGGSPPGMAFQIDASLPIGRGTEPVRRPLSAEKRAAQQLTFRSGPASAPRANRSPGTLAPPRCRGGGGKSESAGRSCAARQIEPGDIPTEGARWPAQQVVDTAAAS